jgi:hypothetical protein
MDLSFIAQQGLDETVCGSLVQNIFNLALQNSSKAHENKYE